MVPGKPLYVFWIVKHSFALHLYVAGVVLPQTLKAWPSESGSVRSPVRPSQLAEPVRPSANPTVDYGNQVAVGDQIKHISPPGPVNAREKQIAIQRGSVSLLLIHGCYHRLDPEGRSGSTFPQKFRE